MLWSLDCLKACQAPGICGVLLELACFGGGVDGGGGFGPSDANEGGSNDEWAGFVVCREVACVICVLDWVVVEGGSPVLVRYADGVLYGYEQFLV